MTVPVLYYLSERGKHKHEEIECIEVADEILSDATEVEVQNGHETATSPVEVHSEPANETKKPQEEPVSANVE